MAGVLEVRGRELHEIETVFFDAMLEGWANPNAKKIQIPGLPGSKGIVYRSGLFVAVDCYFAPKGSKKSSGFTLITYDNAPVWIMHYGGWYLKEAIPFLKSALMEAYSARKFFGGRGPVIFEDENKLYRYENFIELNHFPDSRGWEKVTRLSDGKIVGSHNYNGMLLLEI